METIIDFDLLQRIKNLDNCRDNDLDSFPSNTCCDYVDSLVQDGKRFGVVMFVEPSGNITKWGASWKEVLSWWERVFQLQPKDWDYIRAGWFLDGLEILPDNPEMVWPLEAVRIFGLPSEKE